MKFEKAILMVLGMYFISSTIQTAIQCKALSDAAKAQLEK